VAVHARKAPPPADEPPPDGAAAAHRDGDGSGPIPPASGIGRRRTTAADAVEPASVVAAMASAVARVRRMATTVFRGDDALFADPPGRLPR
jgi:hypothetical protein